MKIIQDPVVKTEDGLTSYEFVCDAGTFKLTPMSNGIIRVQAAYEAQIQKNESFAVVWHGSPVESTIEKTEDGWILLFEKVVLMIYTNPLRLVLQTIDGNIIFEDSTTGGIHWNKPQFICKRKMLGDEHFYGLGEKTGGLDKRGNRYEMWNTDNPEYGLDSDPLYQSIPFFIVLLQGVAHGIFLDNTYRTFFDFGKESNEEYFFGAPDGPLDYYIILGPRISDVINGYTLLTGRPHFVPRWALGYQHSRWMQYSNENDLLDLAKEYRWHQIPCDTIVLDIEYMDEYKIFTWNMNVFPKPRKFISKLNAMNFEVMAIIDPGVKKDEDFEIFHEGIRNNYFLKKRDGSLYIGIVWPGETVFPDFSRKDVQKWFGLKYELLAQSGLSNCSWIDMNEPSNCIFVGLREEYSMNDVIDENGNPWEPRLRNVYGLGMAKSVFEGLLKIFPNQRPFVLTRSGFAGYQRYAATWTGDNRSDWGHLWLSIPMLLNLGLSGIPICGADVGGFFENPTCELLVRWYQLGCFYPFFRNHSCHGTTRREPWLFGNKALEIIKKYVELRYCLLRYIYSLCWESSQNGMPIMRPLVLEFQNDPETYTIDTQFMLGPFLMIAPVLNENAISRHVYFPSGTWFDFWTDTRLQGPARIEITAPLEKLPIFVRAGAVIPCGKVVQHTKEDQGDVFFLVYPEGQSESYLYEDDGVSLQGAYSLTKIILKSSKSVINLQIEKRFGDWKPSTRNIVIEVHGFKKPTTLLIDGSEAVYHWSKNIATIRIPDDGNPHSFRFLTN